MMWTWQLWRLNVHPGAWGGSAGWQAVRRACAQAAVACQPNSTCPFGALSWPNTLRTLSSQPPCTHTCAHPCCRFTGADLYALCADAWMTALKRAIAAQEASTQQRQTSSGGAAAALVAAAADSSGSGEAGAEGGEKEEEGEEEEVTVTQADLLQAADTVQPSLSAAEVARYERIRDEYNSQQSSRQY